MQNYIEAIPTKYNGITFRSKLEATYARLFDYFEMEWMYEVEGYKFQDGTWYLPDFYFPDQDLFVEVKGIMDKLDEHKIDLLNRIKPVIVGFPDGNLKWYYYEAIRPRYNLKISYAPVGISRCPCCKKFQFRMPPTPIYDYYFPRHITDENPFGWSERPVDTTKCLICGQTSMGDNRTLLGKNVLPDYNIDNIKHLFKYRYF